jgi:hypothetical protein
MMWRITYGVVVAFIALAFNANVVAQVSETLDKDKHKALEAFLEIYGSKEVDTLTIDKSSQSISRLKADLLKTLRDKDFLNYKADRAGPQINYKQLKADLEKLNNSLSIIEQLNWQSPEVNTALLDIANSELSQDLIEVSENKILFKEAYEGLAKARGKLRSLIQKSLKGPWSFEKSEGIFRYITPEQRTVTHFIPSHTPLRFHWFLQHKRPNPTDLGGMLAFNEWAADAYKAALASGNPSQKSLLSGVFKQSTKYLRAHFGKMDPEQQREFKDRVQTWLVDPGFNSLQIKELVTLGNPSAPCKDLVSRVGRLQ